MRRRPRAERRIGPGARAAGVSVAMMLALAACQTTPPPVADVDATSADTPVPAPTAEKTAAPEAPEAAPPEAAPPAGEDADAATAGPTPAGDETAKVEPAAPETPPEPPPPPPIDDDPDQVMGLDHGALRALLGAPGFTRREAAAQVWQYRARACVLDIFLYGETDGRYRVTYYEFRGDRLEPADERRCFRALLGAADPG